MIDEFGNRARPSPFRLLLCVAGLAAALSSCSTSDDPAGEGFPIPPPPRPFSPSEILKQFDTGAPEPYRLGEGDQLTIQVWEKPELSGVQTIGPDGSLTVPLVGTIHVSGLTREDAAKAIRDALSRLYSGIVVTVKVDQYIANRITVLGRVKTQGVMRFDTVPTLLEAIARAGGLAEPITTNPSNLSHAAVLRGRDRIAWIDLQTLMDGRDLSLNLRLKPDDVVLVPEDSDLPVYVLGEVTKPGPYRWTRNMTVLDALSIAGGMTRDAHSYGITVVRPSQNRRVVVSQSDMLDPQVNSIVALERGDIVYVPSNILAKIGYFLEKIDIFNWVFIPGALKK